MAFSPQFLDELRLRIGLADIIGRRVKLVRKGREHHGLCPFHKEKTPSFTVNEEKGFYHCFGCGAHGSAIDFVMQSEGMSFPEAVERLAGEAGMEVPQDSPEERLRARRRATLYDVMEAACAYFEACLRAPQGAAGLAYFKGRGLDDATIKAFRLGLAPDSRDGLKNALIRQGVGEDQMVAAGLIIRPEESGRAPYDRFRGRVMFPIVDRRERIIAFGGRLIAPGEPKYLNSPETELFHKGRVLYGLPQARVGARNHGTVVVTEGYMDVIALAQAGLTGAVAPLGTALGEDQIHELWKITPDPILCFDGDAAGKRAARRAAERVLAILRPGFGLHFAWLPEGDDPDSLVRRGGIQAMRDVLAAARPLSEVLWTLESGGAIPQTPEARAALQSRLEALSRQIQDATVRSHFVRAFKEKIWPRIDGAATMARTRPTTQGGRWREKNTDGPRPLRPVSAQAGPARHRGDDETDLTMRREMILIATIINHPDIAEVVDERLGSMAFSSPLLDKLRQDVLKSLSEDESLDSKGLERHLRGVGFDQILTSVLGEQVFEHAFFARPQTDTATALEGWEKTYALLRHKSVTLEIQEIVRLLGQEATGELLERLRVLQDQERMLAGKNTDEVGP
ncbi:DNA primase [Varunaivibrio sulfuroxidans]|uniref:DNA primase n=1 Tax=Varunaivibrio sulfuroxidans TaxID=1773489 RepID=A0A4R3JGU1_9PROT|nr:DNA primase [Varunaivibrio sulfuroxidans]TCS64705.1 DNA primase [Varunaivibrio sulfuroxidans]WES29988.1 DNA primase [Varunaivibrio sulfuroxidans]